MGFLPIKTERLTLRTFHESDFNWIKQLYSCPDVSRFLLDEPWSYQMATGKLAQRIAQADLDGPAHALALAVETEALPIGCVSLWFTDVEHRIAEIGWVFAPSSGGKGYATEAAAAVVDLAFTHYSCHRIAAKLDARNHASARLAERLGMSREAHHRQDCFSKGEWTSTVVYAMLASDYSARN